MTTLSRHDRRFASRLASVRKVRGMTQEQLADACDLHRAVIAAIETGTRGIRLGEAVDMCEVLDVDLIAMVGEAPLLLPVPAMTIE